MSVCTYVNNQDGGAGEYKSNNIESSEKANAPILQVREFGFMPLQMAYIVNNLQCTDESTWVQ